MSKLPKLTGKKVVAALKSDGFSRALQPQLYAAPRRAYHRCACTCGGDHRAWTDEKDPARLQNESGSVCRIALTAICQSILPASERPWRCDFRCRPTSATRGGRSRTGSGRLRSRLPPTRGRTLTSLFISEFAAAGRGGRPNVDHEAIARGLLAPTEMKNEQ